MRHSFFVAPTGYGTGLTSVCLGLLNGLDKLGLKLGFCKPIEQHQDNTQADPSLNFVQVIQNIQPPQPLTLALAQKMMAEGKEDDLMELIVDICQRAAKGADVLILEGLVPQENSPFIHRINSKIATTLDSQIILVAAQNKLNLDELANQINITANAYCGTNDSQVLGYVLNKVGKKVNTQDAILPIDTEIKTTTPTPLNLPNVRFKCIGQIPFSPQLLAPRMIDVVKHLTCEILNDNAQLTRRISQVTICARTVHNMLDSLKSGTLLITPGDRDDVLLVACMAALNGVQLAGILLTGGYKPGQEMLKLCQQAVNTGLPILLDQSNTYLCAQKLSTIESSVPADDMNRMQTVMSEISEALDLTWLAEKINVSRNFKLSPAAFRHHLIESARQQVKRIVLPEGEEIRTIQAAIICAEKNIAHCILLGDKTKILLLADSLSLTIPSQIEIIDPQHIAADFIVPLQTLRKHKKMSVQQAEEQLEDPVVLGTMMLALDQVDGLVSGAVNTTANTIRPALQLIKTKPDTNLVSSIFFMCLPEQVVIYGDCAVNPDPTAEQLAEIAIQSGDSAKAFGIEPKIAMISYSTGASGGGADVDKVIKATALAKEKRPDLLIDGPLQYDAASVVAVAKSKAPNSPVAGKANVFVFPDLNTGNTTYKAVQRSANVISIGPMLQGLNKSVNDLSRGALVDDIVYTIALTAIQAQ
ncbi:phosphate acetyltransferase [Algibacillus agarilyticus]|uniref:phosphate acetyltransferase n=1 Tax=Algibacillus agarilyticus TaxID=2234133 RepID=UPI000DD0503A|nr:phosphate acetyltransferase [Algibacillus agarilyticus]